MGCKLMDASSSPEGRRLEFMKWVYQPGIFRRAWAYCSTRDVKKKKNGRWQKQYQACHSENLSPGIFGNPPFGLKKSVNNGSKFKEAEAPFHSANLTIEDEFLPLPFSRLIHISTYGRQVMTSWPDLEPMPNRLVNYGVTDNGIAIIELASNSAGAPLEGRGRTEHLHS